MPKPCRIPMSRPEKCEYLAFHFHRWLFLMALSKRRKFLPRVTPKQCQETIKIHTHTHTVCTTVSSSMAKQIDKTTTNLPQSCVFSTKNKPNKKTLDNIIDTTGTMQGTKRASGHSACALVEPFMCIAWQIA